MKVVLATHLNKNIELKVVLATHLNKNIDLQQEQLGENKKTHEQAYYSYSPIEVKNILVTSG